MGYPAKVPIRPRYPLNVSPCLKKSTPQLDDWTIQQAMQVMDDGYLAQDYYPECGLYDSAKG